MKERKGYKTSTIILSIIVILETLFIIWIFNIGNEMIEQENECAINICNDEIYESYFYDDYEEVCYCYGDNELVYQEYIGGKK